MQYALIWVRPFHEKEEIDSFDTRAEALRMRKEYKRAFKYQGHIVIQQRGNS